MGHGYLPFFFGTFGVIVFSCSINRGMFSIFFGDKIYLITKIAQKCSGFHYQTKPNVPEQAKMKPVQELIALEDKQPYIPFKVHAQNF